MIKEAKNGVLIFGHTEVHRLLLLKERNHEHITYRLSVMQQNNMD
jgi:hypothetical protein